MPAQTREFTIFVSCPGDVDAERDAVEEVVAAINKGVFAHTHGLRCRTISWKRDTASNIAESAQHTIDEQLPDYDIYLGIMSRRFGSPAGKVGSGTEHEFNSAFKLRTETGRPWIMFFFREGAPLSIEELSGRKALGQVRHVIQFRKRVQKQGLSKSYSDLEGFREALRHDLEFALHQLSGQAGHPSEARGANDAREQFEKAARSFTESFALSKTNARYVEVNCKDSDGNPRGLLSNALNYVVGTQNKSVLVLGEFGSGKTTFALRYVYTLGERWLAQPGETTLPLFLRLREYRDAESIEDWILDQLAKKLGVNLEHHAFARFIREQPIMAVLDGLDEVVGVRGEQSVRRLIKELAKLVNRHMTLIVTCRTTFYESQVQGIVPFERLYIEKFDHHQVIDCARKSLPGEWEGFVKSIEERFINLSELAARPLFLKMMIQLQQNGRLHRINNAGDLYSEITSAWLAKESLRDGAMLNEHARRMIVQYLAFQMMIRERGYFDIAELHDLIREMMKRREVPGLENFDVDQVIRDISNAAFMDADRQNKFWFAHQSFMEFFVAEKFVRELLAGDTRDFGQRILYEEIYEHLALLTNTTDKRRPILNVLSNAEGTFIAKVNCIPPLRKQRTPEAIPFLLSAIVNDSNPLVRYVCGYTLAIFREEYPDIINLPSNREFLVRAYHAERNSLIRCRLALLISSGAYDGTWPELAPTYPFDAPSLEAIVEAPGIVSAYEHVLRVRREHAAVIEESMRLLALFIASERDANGMAKSVLTKFIFADGFAHTDERVRRMTIWVIVFLRLFDQHASDGAQARQILSKAHLDRSLIVRTIARWADASTSGLNSTPEQDAASPD